MILTALAIIPSIALLIYIYKKDNKDKEPVKFLMTCFAFGVMSSIPAIILESIEDYIIYGSTIEGSIIFGILEAFVVAAVSEELCKYLLLKMRSWKSKYFDCTFDGIVYAVFVSLGFATLENLSYVAEFGILTALVRMFTSVPGHMCFAVFMGYFYSKAKIAYVNGDKVNRKKYSRKAFWIPVVLHGLYDFPLMLEEEAVGEAVTIITMLFWLAYVIALITYTFIFVNKASKEDEYILITANGENVVTSFSGLEAWICPECNSIAHRNFCARCGRARFYG